MGADKNKLLQALRGNGKIDEIEFKEKLNFLSLMAKQLLNIAYHKLKNSILIEDL